MPSRRRSDAGGGGSRGRATLSAILAAAGELASLEGLEQLSMGRLASAVGMSKSGLYAHFDSKEELQLATVEHVCQVFEAEVLRNPSDVSNDGLGGLLERWLDFFERKRFPGGCFLIVGAVEFAGRPGSVRDALASAIDREIGALETAIQRANETGELSPEKDAKQTAFELHAILMNAHALFQITRDPEVFQRARVAIQGVIR